MPEPPATHKAVCVAYCLVCSRGLGHTLDRGVPGERDPGDPAATRQRPVLPDVSALLACLCAYYRCANKSTSMLWASGLPGNGEESHRMRSLPIAKEKCVWHTCVQQGSPGSGTSGLRQDRGTSRTLRLERPPMSPPSRRCGRPQIPK